MQSRKSVKPYDEKLQTGMPRPAGFAPLARKSVTRAIKAEATKEDLSTPRRVIEAELKTINKLIEKATRVDDFTSGLTVLPTDIPESSLAAKLEARQMIVNFLKQQKARYQRRLKKLKEDQ
jgi:hypothetical protein